MIHCIDNIMKIEQQKQEQSENFVKIHANQRVEDKPYDQGLVIWIKLRGPVIRYVQVYPL